MISVPLNLVLPENIKIERKLHIDREQDRKLFERVLDEARLCFSPRYSYKSLKIDDKPIPELLSSSRDLKEFMEGSLVVFIVICTIGQGFEELADKYKMNGDVSALFFLDRIGSDTVENLAQYSSIKLFKQFYAKEGTCSLSRRYSPGYGDLPLQRQQQIFSLFMDDDMDVSLTESGFMRPEKSISYIVGVKND